MNRRALFFSFLFFTGCAVGPNYTPPEDQLSGEWVSTGGEELSLQAPPENWWEYFDDPLLNKYIDQASKTNLDVLTASANILVSRALRTVAASSFFPHVNADVNATKTYFSKNGPAFTFGDVPNTPGLPFALQVPQIQNLYNVFFDASWEIDLFGKTRRTVEAANAIIGRTIEERNDKLITVFAEIARNYIELRVLQKKELLIREALNFLDRKKQISLQQLEFGLVGKIDIDRIEASFSEEKALLPGIEAEIYKKIYLISILTGNLPETLLEELLPYQNLPRYPTHLAVGLKTDLLRRRPDIRRAERNLAAATANIGVAVAQFFPTVSILGDGGLQSLRVGNLFSWGSRTWAVGGDVNLPIFQGGKLRGNLHAKRAETIAAGYQYQQTVLKALEEVESALITYTKDLQAFNEIQTATNRYQNIVSISQKQHETGLIDQMRLLDAKLTLNESERELLKRESETLLEVITLYKVLGGGWSIFCEIPR
jgi:multidrug efflux system outer membrane protein